MSRTAILLTGHMRTFDRCLPTLYHHVFRHYPAADYFISTVDDADAPKVHLLRDYLAARQVYPGGQPPFIAIDILPSQPVLPLPAGCPPEDTYTPGVPFMHEPYAISVPPQAILRQLWQLNQAWAHFCTAVQADGRQISDYTTVIRVRPDSYFHSFENNFRHLACAALTPWWGRFGGINDRFALLSLDAAEAYHTTWRYLDQLVADGCPLHPESLIKQQLSDRGIILFDNLAAVFSTLKQIDGHLEARPPEISPIDIADASR